VIALLVNPVAGRGRALRKAYAVEAALRALGHVTRYETQSRGDEQRCARDACAAGATLLAVVGGDGSVHHAARGLLDAGASIPLAIFSAGTGNDFVKTLRTPAHDVAAMVARIAAGHTATVDIGIIDSVPFLNAAGLGFDVEVLERMQRPLWFTGTAAYVVTALRALFGYTGFTAQQGNDVTAASDRRLMTVFANGRVFGGTFQIAPAASLTDGQLDVVNIASLAPLARPAVFWRATRGTHLRHPAVQYAQVETTTLTSPTPLSFQADGELYRARSTTIHITVRPAALRVIV
jgi:diacylglycerol kinase (ATP)